MSTAINLGRFWEVGPTTSLYVPHGFLKEGANSLIVFETEGRLPRDTSTCSTTYIQRSKGGKLMTIVGCRIDGRLIHGQVANLWTTKLNVSRIMVIDDEVAQNDIEKSGLKLATPPGVKLSILPVAKAAENILAGKYDSQRLFIVARKPDRFLRLIEAGVQLETLNVGNMSQSDETRAITRSINVVDADVEDFNKIHEKGVKITSQMVPNDHCRRLYEVIKVKENF